jgi:hypothetical protein
MTVFMKVLMLVLSLLACYFPAVAGARGRGSRKLWIGFVFVGLFIALGTIKLGGTSSFWISSPNAVSMLYETIIRMAIGFAFGSFLAVLLCRKKQSIEDLSLK